MKTRAAVAYAPGQPLVVEEVDLEGPQGGRGARRDQGDGRLPHRRVHALGRRSRGAVPGDLRPRGRGRRARGRAGRDVARARRSRDPAVHAGVPRLQVVPVAQDQPVHRDPRDAGQGPDARRHEPVLDQGHSASITTWAARRSRTTRCCRRSRSRRSAADAPFDKICYIGCGVTTGHRRGDLHGEGRGGREASWCSGSAASASTSCRARGWSAPIRSSASTSTRRARRSRRVVRHDALRQSEGDARATWSRTSSSSPAAARTTASSASAT